MRHSLVDVAHSLAEVEPGCVAVVDSLQFEEGLARSLDFSVPPEAQELGLHPQPDRGLGSKLVNCCTLSFNCWAIKTTSGLIPTSNLQSSRIEQVVSESILDVRQQK